MRTLAVIFATGMVGSLCELALGNSGVGLSGAGYGLFGLLWVPSRQPGKHQGIIDGPTTRLFVGWFFICIVLTYAKIMPIANAAHGGGALAGFLLGYALVGRRSRDRWLARGGMVAMVAIAATLAWPGVWLLRDRTTETAAWKRAGQLLEEGQYEEAIPLWQTAIKADPSEWRTRYNLALTYDRMGKIDLAVETLRLALKRGGDRDAREYMVKLLERQGLLESIGSAGDPAGDVGAAADDDANATSAAGGLEGE